VIRIHLSSRSLGVTPSWRGRRGVFNFGFPANRMAAQATTKKSLSSVIAIDAAAHSSKGVLTVTIDDGRLAATQVREEGASGDEPIIGQAGTSGAEDVSDSDAPHGSVAVGRRFRKSVDSNLNSISEGEPSFGFERNSNSSPTRFEKKGGALPSIEVLGTARQGLADSSQADKDPNPTYRPSMDQNWTRPLFKGPTSDVASLISKGPVSDGPHLSGQTNGAKRGSF